MKNEKFLVIQPKDLETGPISLEDSVDNFIFIYLIKNEFGELSLNYQKPMDYGDNPKEETVIRSQNGIYELKVYSLKGNLLEKISFNPSNNLTFELIVIPNYLNIGKIELVNLTKNQASSFDLSSVAVCNENNICEEGEKGLCPLDCPQVNNPNYPLSYTISSNRGQDDLIITTETKNIEQLPPPKNYFYQIVFFSLTGFIIIFLIALVFIKKIRK